MDDPRVQRLERELDHAINQARLLRERVGKLQVPVESGDAGLIRKRRLHAFLDFLQRITPGFLRAAVRNYYLRYFYFRVYPERSPLAVLAPAQTTLNPLVAHSGYAPFLDFKQRLSGELSMDFGGLSVDCQPGLVSVVLPVHNGARFVAEAVESVLHQDYCDFELIVVDDGSTDETPQILERWAGNPRVRLLRQPNRKLPAALNAGFAAARGEFFTWISDDNLMHAAMLSTLARFLGSHTDAEMVYAHYDLIDERGAPAMDSNHCREIQSPGASNVIRTPCDPGELNFIQNNFIGPCFLYRAWAARMLGGYAASGFGFEDYDYWMRMNALFRVAHLGESAVLYSYRLHADSLTARDAGFRIADRARYAMAVEAERRRFFSSAFDITFRGRHPWFILLARAYRRAGHNVMEIPESNAEAQYRYEMTRAYPKAIVISDAPGEFALLRGNCLAAAGLEFRAPDAGSLEYPLLALANSVLWTAKG